MAPGVGLLQAGVHTVELPLVGTRSDPKLQPTAADQVEEGRLSGQVHRVPVGGNGYRSTEADPVSVACPPGEDLEGVGGDGHLEGMVFGSPGDGEPALLSHLDHLEGVAGHLVHITAVVESFQVDSELEPHISWPFRQRWSGSRR